MNVFVKFNPNFFFPLKSSLYFMKYNGASCQTQEGIWKAEDFMK